MQRSQVEVTLVLDGCARTELGQLRWGSVLIEPFLRPLGASPFLLASPSARLLRIDSARCVALPDDRRPWRALVVRSPRLFLLGLMVGAKSLEPTEAFSSEMARAIGSAAYRSRLETFEERPWLESVRGTLHEHFNCPVSMRAVARKVGMHPAHVSRGFAQRYGMTMTQYVRDLRIMRAGELLVTTGESLSRIAQTTGFSDHAHFTHVFAARIGISPSAFRRGTPEVGPPGPDAGGRALAVPA